MGKIAIKLLAVGLLTIVSSCNCFKPDPVWNVSTIKYGDSEETIHRIYRIDDRNNHDVLIFYDDGTTIKDTPEYHAKYYKQEGADMQTVLNLTERYYKKHKRHGKRGIYKKVGKDIYVDEYWRFCFFYHDWDIQKYHYEVIGDSMLVLKERSWFSFEWDSSPIPKCVKCTQHDVLDEGKRYRRLPDYQFPNPDTGNYVKQKKWAWRNETDYEEWEKRTKDEQTQVKSSQRYEKK